MKPDYPRIADLERELYGEVLTVLPAAAATLRRQGSELDAAVRDAALFLAFRRVPVFEGIRVFSVCRVLVWAVLTLAVVWLCLMVAGVVPWS